MTRVAIDKTYLRCYIKKIINIISSKFLYFENFFQDYFFIKFLGMHGEYAPDILASPEAYRGNCSAVAVSLTPRQLSSELDG